ncbi:MAG TPA: response regulator [Kofleriaceae bacterium]|nr:response regulator [Kofleriaceae bacterium]
MPLRILIVEDDRNSREVLTELLSDEGHTVDACPAAAKALAQLETTTYDVLLTDLVMPGMSGIELVRIGRTSAPHMRCFVMTGLHPVGDDPDVRWIQKPIDFDHLLERLGN